MTCPLIDSLLFNGLIFYFYFLATNSSNNSFLNERSWLLDKKFITFTKY
jgi:hypothetical protein